MKCGLLGQHLGHSYSPALHAMLGEYEYVLFEKEPSQLEHFLRNGDFSGLNVTLPYKKAIIPYLDQLTPVAQRLGAVNTVVRRPDGTLLGHNTDYFGFQYMVRQSGLSLAGKKALLLGSGGASNTAQAVLQELGVNVTVISRQGEHTYDDLHLHTDAALIVNATPVGMYPHCGCRPLDLALFPRLEGVLDVIYNPARTQLLLDAEKRHLCTVNGLWMLVAQAKQSAEFFTGETVPDEKMQTVFRRIREKTENLILIGMPGCGKSTIGALLAEKTGKKLIDTDAEIEKIAKKSIPDIFAQDGEPAFRALERTVLQQYGKCSGLVIATGGGCVKNAENFDFLHQNGRIFYLNRSISKLPTDGRPLSVDLEALFAQREALYLRFSDHTVDNNGTPECTISQILEAIT